MRAALDPSASVAAQRCSCRTGSLRSNRHRGGTRSLPEGKPVVTSNNPGPGGPQDPANHQETAQWWATPPTGAEAGQPVTGADPTMLNYGTAGMPYTPQAQPFPPQQQLPPQMSQPHQQMPPPVNNYPGQQPYMQQQPGPAPMNGGYNYGTPPRPPGGGNKTPWIIGGVVGLVVIVGIGIGALALTSKDKPISPLGDDKKKNMDGNYSMDTVTNSCSLIDPTALAKWSSTQKSTPEHSETKASDYTGGRASCNADYYSASATDKYQTNTARIALDVEFTGAYGGPQYDSWKQYDTGTTGSGRTSGDVTGIGSAGYWHAETRDYSSFNDVDYTVAVKDSNVSVKVQISLNRASGEPVSKDDVATVAKQQVQKVLDGLKKK